MIYKQGDKVQHSYLGRGVVKENFGVLVLVLFAKTPPEKYNCGTNPALVFNSDLTKIVESDIQMEIQDA